LTGVTYMYLSIFLTLDLPQIKFFNTDAGLFVTLKHNLISISQVACHQLFQNMVECFR
jgi:hypothetical protein